MIENYKSSSDHLPILPISEQLSNEKPPGNTITTEALKLTAQQKAPFMSSTEVQEFMGSGFRSQCKPRV